MRQPTNRRAAVPAPRPAGSARPATLVPLCAAAADAPDDWAAAAALGPSATAIICRPDPLPTTSPQARADLAAEIARLGSAGVRTLGHISLGYATRPVADVCQEVTCWASVGVLGLFFDHAPAGVFEIGPVAVTVRAARRSGLHLVVLNAGVAVDPIYRSLGTTICTFEGSWREYLHWSGEEAQPGDGHLIYAAPRDEWEAAVALVTARRAGLMLVTERTTPYSSAPYTSTPATSWPGAGGAAPC